MWDVLCAPRGSPPPNSSWSLDLSGISAGAQGAAGTANGERISESGGWGAGSTGQLTGGDGAAVGVVADSPERSAPPDFAGGAERRQSSIWGRISGEGISTRCSAGERKNKRNESVRGSYP